LNEVSFGKVLFDLFQVAQRFQITLQPQLLMLQKTLLNVEGLARQLDPELDIWGVAKPELEAILREKHTLGNIAHELRERLPGWLAQAPEIPGLVHEFLVKSNNGQRLKRTTLEDAASSIQEQRHSQRNKLQVMAGGSLIISAAILTAMETGPWFLWGYSVAGLAFLAVGGWLIIRALR
jgi:ubiquinone biosynthesis protein